MNKSSKGLLAAATGGVLLLGGAGSLAYWTDSVSVGGGTINSGKLELSDTTSGTCALAPWTLDSDESPVGVEFEPATDTLVPGDVLTKTCTYTVGAEGTHLRAELTATGGAATGTLAAALTTTATFTESGSPVTSVTEANDGDVVEATISVEFVEPGSEDNNTQELSAALSDYEVTLTQVHD